MSDWRIEKVQLNSDGVKALLQSKEVMNCLKDNAGALGVIDAEYIGFDRAHVVVKETDNAN